MQQIELILEPKKALAILERFVVENDDLLDLEKLIGRFNIFDALRVDRAEIRHSNFLSWLLNPAESHGQGSLFLNAILMDLFKASPVERRPFSPIELDGEELRGVEIRREWNYIDLLITCRQPSFLVAIENKIDSGEGKGQLEKYRNVVAGHFPGTPALFVFLTTDGADPTDDAWNKYTYADIHRVLDRVLKTEAGAIGNDVSAFLKHYLRLIGSRFMEDSEIDDLCRRIYTNHRQAIDLIVSRVDSSGVTAELRAVLEANSEHWHIFNSTPRRIDFVPRAWLEWIPKIGTRPNWDPRMWLRWWVCHDDGECRMFVEIGPTSDPELRTRVIAILTDPDAGFGCRVKGVPTSTWTRIRRDVVAKWTPGGEPPDAAQLALDFRKRLDKISKELAGVPVALIPAISESTSQK